MDLMFNSILFGILILLLYRICNIVLRYINLCRKLRFVPQKPCNWLAGHGNEVKDSTTYMQYCFDIMSKGSKLYCFWIGPFPGIGVCHPETFVQLNKQVLLKARGHADGYRLMEPWIGEGLLVSGDKKWERNRRLLTPAFHFDILIGYIHVMNEVTGKFLDRLAEASKDGKSVDVSPYVCAATLDSMLKCSLSYNGTMQVEKEHEYIAAVRGLSALLWRRLLKPILLFDTIYRWTSDGKENKRLVDVAHRFTRHLIKDRQRALKEQPDLSKHKRRLDFLDILLTARDEQGHDTTASAISFAIYALGQYPDIQQRVYDDVQTVLDDRGHITHGDLSKFRYLVCFIKEVMRFYSPVPVVARKHNQTIVLDGIEIPPGPRVDINIYAIHHNPQVWNEPEEFNPGRFLGDNREEKDVYGFIPFSAGARNCIGQVFAMNEIKITLALLVKRFQVLPVQDHKACLLPDIVMRSSNRLPVYLQERTY